MAVSVGAAKPFLRRSGGCGSKGPFRDCRGAGRGGALPLRLGSRGGWPRPDGGTVALCDCMGVLGVAAPSAWWGGGGGRGGGCSVEGGRARPLCFPVSVSLQGNRLPLETHTAL